MQQQQQQPMGSIPPTNITTEQIQKYLEENKQLILAILDNQNLGRLAECAQYQALLQKNLLYLAAIADAQPQSPAMRPQMTPQAAMPLAGGAQYMQQPGPNFPPKTPLQFAPQQVQELQQQQQLHHQPHMMPFPGQPEARGATPSSLVDAGGAVSKNVNDESQKNSAAELYGNPRRSEETKTP